MAEPENKAPAEEELQLSSPADLKKNRDQRKTGVLIKLVDSGLVVRVARPTLTGLLKRGVIPSSLVNASLKLETNDAPKTSEEVLEMQDVIDRICLEAVVEPKLVKDNPAEGELELEDLSEQDRSSIYTYVQIGLEPFRRLAEETARITAGLSVQPVPGNETKPANGNRKQRRSV